MFSSVYMKIEKKVYEAMYYIVSVCIQQYDPFCHTEKKPSDRTSERLQVSRTAVRLIGVIWTHVWRHVQSGHVRCMVSFRGISDHQSATACASPKVKHPAFVLHGRPTFRPIHFGPTCFCPIHFIQS